VDHVESKREAHALFQEFKEALKEINDFYFTTAIATPSGQWFSR
jgi:hypothetical protein